MRAIVVAIGIVTVLVLAPLAKAGQVPTHIYKAIRESHQKYGVPMTEAISVARCESVDFTDFWHGPGIYPPAHLTPSEAEAATGVFQFLLSTWKGTPYRRFPRTNVRANALAAGWLWLHDGRSWQEWDCQPT
jgi:hypothetical protein